MRLKEAAGWNQTEDDWSRLLELAPEGCFAMDCDGALAATMTAISYGGELAWIGMALTAPEFRKRGFARMLMGHTLDYLQGRGISWVKLDATEMGAKLYSDFDFQFECFVERWRRSAGPEWGFHEKDCDRSITLAEMVEQDTFGVSRAPLLDALLRSGNGSIRDGGFALWRSGSLANYFGPSVATHAELAEHLLQCCLKANGASPLLWDLPSQNAAAVQLAGSYGFSAVRKLSRMACRLRVDASPPQAAVHSIFALAGFEYG